MITVNDIDTCLFRFFETLFGANRQTFGFDVSDPNDAGACYIAERQNQALRPYANTLLYYRVDDVNDWGSRVMGTTVSLENGLEYVLQYKVLSCVVNVLSKTKGQAFDASNFLVGMAESSRYDTYINNSDNFLHLKSVEEMRNLSSLENSTWSERVQTKFIFNFTNKIENSEPQYVVNIPQETTDVADSVDYEVQLKQGI